MAFVVELVFRGEGTDRPGLAEAHRAYWRRMAARGLLLGGGPWRDGAGELLLCEAPDRRTLLRVLHADPYARAKVVGKPRIREWNAVMGHVALTGPEPVPPVIPVPPVMPLSAREESAVREELTAHERRIAAMVLDGLTNRQIAGAFSVSTRAVELHLTRIYRKLGIRRRAQLAAAVHRSEATPARAPAPPGPTAEAWPYGPPPREPSGTAGTP
ncbi:MULTISPECIES: LuxR C-terminal-related transcriptional regulator [unclassified Streptomyces]|uniref:LuxR C-terminal-related transcriptional regulator n=1 Tax=unclassified Streptomyces TaxID=2593676 RepID=UPI00099D6B29|nr:MULTISPECIES: LuxR C-terminal-related transcriptional regulator [unclassified Streptomyces]